MSILNISNVRHMKQCGPDFGFNCWGATLHAIGEAKSPFWADIKKMTSFLEKKTVINEGNLKKGDILVIWNQSEVEEEGELVHTATYVGGGRWFHKMGANNSYYDTKKNVINPYKRYCHNGVKTEIRRLA